MADTVECPRCTAVVPADNELCPDCGELMVTEDGIFHKPIAGQDDCWMCNGTGVVIDPEHHLAFQCGCAND